MKEKQSFFEENKYVYLSNFIDKENCGDFVTEFKKLVDQGLTTKDTQCPLSHSIGHCVLFDSLLEQLTPSIEKVTGKKLHPTYAYARWYAPGDELKIHKDRPACEISATINLGFEGDQWPIYVGHQKNKEDAKQINMNVGDAVVYKGCEIYHWREKYVEGKWQAQVFIHYVDAEGPNAEWKYDKREKLAHHDDPENYRFNYISQTKKNALSKKSCEAIINSLNDNKEHLQDALLVGMVLDKEIRDSKKILLPPDQGIGATLAGIGLAANYKVWKYNINHSDQSEYLQYGPAGHFSEHIDTIFNTDAERKLTIILFLNDDYEGGRLYIKAGKDKIYPPQELGDVLVFPSFLLHCVEPVISGTRRTIVSWLRGPSFK
tara:strand:- start:732 stop:1856 length:1125 start_codon:yes stop_codon:yes gene_type:complete